MLRLVSTDIMTHPANLTPNPYPTPTPNQVTPPYAEARTPVKVTLHGSNLAPTLTLTLFLTLTPTFTPTPTLTP